MREIFLGANSPEDVAKKASSHLGGDYLVGIKRGQTFLVFRDGKLVGRIEIEKIPSTGSFLFKESFGRGRALSRGSFFVVYEKEGTVPAEFLNEMEIALEKAILKEANEEMLEEIKRLFERLKTRESLIFKNHHSKVTGAVLSSLGHKINNKLTAIIGYTQMLLYELGNNSASKAKLERILENAHLISQKLQKAMGYFQDWMCEYEDNLLNVLERSLEKREELFSKEGIEVLKEIEESLEDFPVNGLLMEFALDEVFQNAFENLKEADKKLLKIEGRIKDGTAILKFFNYGPAPVKDIEKAFEPFFSTKRGGWGLGLNLVHGVVTRVHGGSVDIWNEKGGVCLEMEIPKLEVERREIPGEVAILCRKKTLADLLEVCLERDRSGCHGDRPFQIKALISEEDLKEADFSAKLLFVEDPFVNEDVLKRLLEEGKVERVFVFSSKKIDVPGIEKIGKEANLFDIYLKIKEAKWKN